MYASDKQKTGLWLSELTHIYHTAKEKGWNITGQNPFSSREMAKVVTRELEKL